MSAPSPTTTRANASSSSAASRLRPRSTSSVHSCPPPTVRLKRPPSSSAGPLGGDFGGCGAHHLPPYRCPPPAVKEPSNNLNGRMTVIQLVAAGIAGVGADLSVDVTLRKLYVANVSAGIFADRFRARMARWRDR
ncbi:hypothetical protein B296_00041785 [Ensete ventricosum]|uniref:Uncharacterized protein n=1 Tax=Ensete ventricosum TaxID=4639 RepID=A0A426YHE6_ENSVE|nr:hypothetical protein B296_00041785 [Ensete ventricosum]